MNFFSAAVGELVKELKDLVKKMERREAAAAATAADASEQVMQTKMVSFFLYCVHRVSSTDN